MAMTKQWKETERRVARKLNGKRLGATGAATADVVSDWLSVEVKHRKRLPAWLWDAYRQARNGTNGDRLAIVVLHEHGKQDDMVLLSLKDFIEWFGG